MSPIRILLLLFASFDLSFSISIGISRNPGRSILRAITDADPPDVAVELNSSNFDPFLRESSIPFAIVEFFAHWCPACRNYKPHYEKVARLFNGPHAVHPGIVLMTRVDCALKINTKLCDRFSVGHYPMLLWGPPSKFASGRWEPGQDKGDIKSIDDGRTADRLLNWINQQMSSTFSFDDEKYENEHLFSLKESDPGQVARAIYDVEEATDEAFDIILEHKTDTSLEVARQHIQEQLSAATAEMVMLSTNEQDEKAKQSKKVVEKNAEAEPPKKSDLSNGENGNKVGTYEEIKSYLKKGSTLSQLSSFLHSLSGSPQEVMNALFEALFEGVEKGFAKEVGKKKNYLATAMQDDQSHMYLLNAIEAFCSKSGAGATKEVALVIKVLYDGDVLEEEHIVRWFKEGIASKQGKNSQIWKNMKPFIEWLQSAESESVEE